MKLFNSVDSDHGQGGEFKGRVRTCRKKLSTRNIIIQFERLRGGARGRKQNQNVRVVTLATKSYDSIRF